MKRKFPSLSLIWLRSRGASLAVLALVAAVLRGYQLATLPPGLSGGEAGIGLSALNLIHHGTWPGLSVTTGFAPLWVVLQALPVWILGHTILALRLWPVVFGVAGVLAIWLWAKDWFGPRVAWVAAGLLAVNPWAITLARSASPAIMATVLLPLTLWAAARALTRNSSGYWWLTGGLIVAGLVSGPLGWTTVGMSLVLAAIGAWKHRQRLVGKASLGGGSLIAVAVAAGIIVAILRWSDIRQLGTAGNFSLKLDALAANIARVAGMFNLHGDDNFLHNFNGAPLLNAFVGLMFVAGILVAVTKLTQRRYYALLIALVLTLIPAIVSGIGVPNAAHAAAALPITMVLAAVGVSYMLDLWYATFPVNSAARSTGLAAILLLLALTVFQGYIQIYRAWSGSAETYLAYDEAAVSVAHYVTDTKVAATHLVVASADEQAVIGYLDYGQTYQTLAPAGIAALPLGVAREFIITANVRDDAAKNLALKFAGGKLAPHYSTFSQNELFYTYETSN